MFENKTANYIVLTLVISGFILSAYFRILAYPVPWWFENDFAHYYVTSWLVRAGTDPYSYVHPLEVATQLGFHPSLGMDALTNPPALAVLLMPLTFFTPKTAFLIWSAVQLISFLAAWIWLEKQTGWDPDVGYKRLFFLIALTSAPIFIHLKYGQGQLFILGVSLVAVSLLLKRRLIAGSFILGFSVSLKLFTWPLIFLPLCIGGVTTLVPFGAGMLILSLPLGIFTGADTFISFYTHAIPFILSSALIYSSNISIPASLTATMNALGITKHYLPALIRNLLPLLCLLFNWKILKASQTLMEDQQKILFLFSALLISSCLFSPTIWPHYLVMLLPALMLSSAMCAKTSTSLYCAQGLGLVSVCVAASIGLITKSDPATFIVSAWWGSMMMIAAASFLFYGARQSPE